MAQRLACRAHNPEVEGSKPSLAMLFNVLVPERSKGYDSSSYGESLVGSNPTQYNIFYIYYL